MITKTFKAKVFAPPRLVDYLTTTHCIFNECLPYVMRRMLDMKHEERGRLQSDFGTEAAQHFQKIYDSMMGIGKAKRERKGRSQSAHAWMEPLTNITNRGRTDWSTSGQLKEVEDSYRYLFQNGVILFDRQTVFPVNGEEWGFIRRLFDTSARRILNHVQNNETQESKKKEAQKSQEYFLKNFTVKSFRNPQQIYEFSDFQNALKTFRQFEEEQQEKTRAIHQPYRITGAMTSGWSEILLRIKKEEDKQGLNPLLKEDAIKIIKIYQKEAPEDFGDYNFFEFLADRPNLWDFVDTMRKYNGFQRQIEKFSKPINFSYPMWDDEDRSEWMEFSSLSPGYMYDLVSLEPGEIELALFVPNEDIEPLQKLGILRTSRQRINLLNRRPITEDTLSNPFLQDKLDLADYETPAENLHYGQVGVHANKPLLDIKKFTHALTRIPFRPESRLINKTKELCILRTEGKGRKKGISFVDTSRGLSSRKNGKKWGCLYDHRLLSPKEKKYSPPRESDYVPLVFEAVRLLFGNSQPFLYFTANLGITIPERKKIIFPKKEDEEPVKSAETSKTSSKKKSKKIPSGLRTLAVDLGQRYAACLTILQNTNGKLSIKPEKVYFLRFNRRPKNHRPLPGVELPKLQQYNVKKSRLQRKTSQILKKRFLLNKKNLNALTHEAGIPLAHLMKALEDNDWNIRAVADELGVPEDLLKKHGLFKSTRVAKGEVFARELTESIQNKKGDRVRKVASAMVRFAVENNIDVILMEDLKFYNPSQEFAHKVNQRLRDWDRRATARWVAILAEPWGIQTFPYISRGTIKGGVPAYWSSHFCSGLNLGGKEGEICGGAGARFSKISVQQALFDFPQDLDSWSEMPRDLVSTIKESIKDKLKNGEGRRTRGKPKGLVAGRFQVIPGGKLFCCRECKRVINADLNASLNLHYIFYNDKWLAERLRRYSLLVDTTKEAREKKKNFFRGTEIDIQNCLNEKYNQGDIPVAGLWDEWEKINWPGA